MTSLTDIEQTMLWFLQNEPRPWRPSALEQVVMVTTGAPWSEVNTAMWNLIGLRWAGVNQELQIVFNPNKKR